VALAASARSRSPRCGAGGTGCGLVGALLSDATVKIALKYSAASSLCAGKPLQADSRLQVAGHARNGEEATELASVSVSASANSGWSSAIRTRSLRRAAAWSLRREAAPPKSLPA
jgi:hypothetical protein